MTYNQFERSVVGGCRNTNNKLFPLLEADHSKVPESSLSISMPWAADRLRTSGKSSAGEAIGAGRFFVCALFFIFFSSSAIVWSLYVVAISYSRKEARRGAMGLVIARKRLRNFDANSWPSVLQPRIAANFSPSMWLHRGGSTFLPSTTVGGLQVSCLVWPGSLWNLSTAMWSLRTEYSSASWGVSFFSKRVSRKQPRSYTTQSTAPAKAMKIEYKKDMACRHTFWGTEDNIREVYLLLPKIHS